MYDNDTATIPKYRICLHVVKEKPCLGGAVLQPDIYRFLNTGDRYMLRQCRTCQTWFLVELDKSSPQ